MINGIKAVVTGGASGLGLAVAKKIVARNGRVTILDINEKQGKAALEQLGPQAKFVACDIRDPASVDSALEKAKEYNGGLNFAVGCAGILGAGRVLGKKGPMDPAHFKQVLDVNLFGSFLLTRAAALEMSKNELDDRSERGVIVHTASIAAYEGQSGQAAYAASKAGVAGMILPLSREFARQGIRICAIAPGVFETPMMQGVSDEVRAGIEAEIPFPARMGDPAEFADMVQHIHDNQYLNGTVIRIDGGARLR